MVNRLMNPVFPALWEGRGEAAGKIGSLDKEGRNGAGTTVMRAEVGKATVEQMAKWTKGQIAYPNLANVTNGEGVKEIADRALAYVQDVKRHYLSVTERVRKQAALLTRQIRGNTLASMGRIDIIHSPEIHKRIERITPRLEEAMFAVDPFFRVRGRRELDRQQALTIMAFMLWQLDAANYDQLIQPAIRSMLIYQFSMQYVWWHRTFDWRHLREISNEYVDGRQEWRSKRTHARVLTFDGPRAKLIDPTNAIIDVRHLVAEDMDFIGHECSETLNDLMSQQEMGFYENVGAIEPSKADHAIFQEQEKKQRSMTPDAVTRMGLSKHAPKDIRVTKLFGRFDLYNDGVERECMFVIANDSTVLRVSENPFDDKIRPYALGLAQRDGFEFFSIGPLDHALSLNNAYDKLRTIGFRAAELSMTPFFSVENGEEAPDTLYDVEPGSRIPGGKLSQIQVTSNLVEALLPWANILREDIDEATGAPPIFGGTDESETATQAVKNLGEANKRMRSYLRAQCDMHTRTLELFYALSRQFVVGETTFRVLGKSAAMLGKQYGVVTPVTFLPEVDFDFVALDGIFNAATRGTAMLQWLNAFAPFLVALPGVNLTKLAKRVWDSMIGGAEDDDIVRVMPMMDELIPQSEENKSLLQGMEVEVHPNDPDEDHLMNLLSVVEELAARAKKGKKVSPDVIHAVTKHFEEHLSGLMRKQNAAAAKAGFQNPAPPTQGQVPGMENRTENPQGDSGMDATSVAQTPTMETPGPGSAQQVAKPGRKSGSTQEANQQ